MRYTIISQKIRTHADEYNEMWQKKEREKELGRERKQIPIKIT